MSINRTHSGGFFNSASALTSALITALVAATVSLLPVAPAAAQGPTPSPFVGIPRQDPNQGPDLMKILSMRRDLSIFTRLFEASGLNSSLSETPFTILAPDDHAFAAVPPDRLNALLKRENREFLRQMLRYHILPGRMMTSDLANVQDGLLVQTLNPINGVVVHSRLPGEIGMNQAIMLTPDIKTGDGVLHVVNSILIPSGQYAAQLFGDRVLSTSTTAELPAAPQDGAGNSVNTSKPLVPRVPPATP